MASNESYIGSVDPWAARYAPTNTVSCTGALLPINQYQAYYSLVGWTWGGDGRNTVGTPDLRGRIPVGTGTGQGLTPRPLASYFGATQTALLGNATVTLVADNLPAHTHNLSGVAVSGQVQVVASTSPASDKAPSATSLLAPVVNGDGATINTFRQDASNLVALNTVSANGTISGSTSPNVTAPTLTPAAVNLSSGSTWTEQPGLAIMYILTVLGTYPTKNN